MTRPVTATVQDPDMLELIAQPTAAKQARMFVRTRLTEAKCHADTIDTAELIISELVTNAIIHVPGEAIKVWVVLTIGRLVLLSVWDPSETMPLSRDAGPKDENGRGMGIIDTLSVANGSRPTEDGKSVWAFLQEKETTPHD